MFKVPFFGGPNWYIVQPVLYRYLERQEWIDAFFTTGELWLSSFSKFHAHQDEHRLDSLEGDLRIDSAYWQPDGTPAYVWARADFGQNAYILCGSMSNSPEIARKFDAAGSIAIQDTTGFAKAVAKHIPGFAEGSEGPCVYTYGPFISRDLGKLPVNRTTGPEQPAPATRAAVQAWLKDRLKAHPYYVKALSFADQLEYRLVWLTDHVVDAHIEIKVPEARVHCQRTTPPHPSQLHGSQERPESKK